MYACNVANTTYIPVNDRIYKRVVSHITVERIDASALYIIITWELTGSVRLGAVLLASVAAGCWLLAAGCWTMNGT